MRLVEILLAIVIALPGVILMAIKERKLIEDFLSEEKVPPYWARVLNHLIMVVPFAILGGFFYKKAGFTGLSFAGINATSLILGVFCALIHAAIYYGYFIKRIDKETNRKVEASRKQLGIWTRLFYGGIVEEVIFRFGLMSFFVWLGGTILPNEQISLWVGNLLAAILFALAHLPAIFQMKVTLSKAVFIYSISMNIMVGLFCGWLYWSGGLSAAILCHMLFHLVWYGFEKNKKTASVFNGFNVKGD
jgi:membrane protease YdiL (CAAX protease family)